MTRFLAWRRAGWAAWLAVLLAAPSAPAQDPAPPAPAPAPVPDAPPAQDPPPASDEDPEAAARRAALDRAFGEITPDGVLAHVKVLSSDELQGREAGTIEGRRAADYVASRFGHAGLEPLGDEGTFFQPFKIDGRLAPAPDCAAGVLAGTRERAWIPDVDFLPFSAAEPPEALGPVVFAGYGISAPESGWDDYAGIDVKGRVVLVLRYTPREKHAQDPFPSHAALRHGSLQRKVHVAAERGAAGLLLVTGPLGPGHGDEGERLDAPPFRGRIPAIQVARSAIDAALQSAGLSLAALQEGIETSGRPASQELPMRARVLATLRPICDLTHNVLGVWRGRDPALAGEALVVGGHYDHVGLGHFGSRTNARGEIHNGADDNASGISGVIAIALALKAADLRPRRSILFMGFGAEEKGLLGSRYYVNHPKWPIEKTIAMVNLDMIGRGAERWCSVNGVGTSPGFRPMVERLNARTGLVLEWSEGGTAPSDNTSFYQKKMPVLFFFTGLHADYHAPADDWDRIEADTLARVTQLALLAAYVLAEAETRPEYRRHDLSQIPRLNFPNPIADAGWIGIEGREAAGGGIFVKHLVLGAPADAAGIREGDVLTHLNETVLRVPADLDERLARLAPTIRVTLGLRRGSETLRLEVTLGRRPK